MSPWFRSLAHLYGRVLEASGHQILVATSDLHFSPGYNLCDEVVAPVRGRSRARSSAGIVRVRHAVARFRPDVVLEDPLTDPRWLGCAMSSPRSAMVHDPQPHDARHRAHGARAATGSIQLAIADTITCFSRASARQVHGRSVGVVPLVSEMPDEWFGGVQRERSGFLLLGRMSRYKGIDIGLAAWKALPEAVRRDNPLHAVVSEGDDALLEDLLSTPGVVVRSGRFDHRDTSDVVARTRAVLLPYRRASQSGVQLLALQHGVQPIVSACDGLREYQPSTEFILDTADLSSWSAAMLRLTSDDVSRAAGARARAHYEQLVRPDALASALNNVLEITRTRRRSFAAQERIAA